MKRFPSLPLVTKERRPDIRKRTEKTMAKWLENRITWRLKSGIGIACWRRILSIQ